MAGSPLLPQPVVHSAASATAELVSCAILTPAEVIKQNAQMVDNSRTDRPRVNATLETLKRFRSNPVALWRGYSALAGRNLPFTALQFPMFERLRQGIRAWRRERGLQSETLVESGLITAVSAGSAGSIAAVVTTPVDVVKTRIMLAAVEGAAQDQRGSPSRSAKDAVLDATGRTVQSAKESVVETVKNVTKPPSRQGSVEIAKEILRDHGMKGLFRGGAVRAVWTMVGSKRWDFSWPAAISTNAVRRRAVPRSLREYADIPGAEARRRGQCGRLDVIEGLTPHVRRELGTASRSESCYSRDRI